MRGKIVNLCIGFMNVLFGILVIIYTKFVPQDKTLMTVQENNIVGYILTGIYIVMFVISFIDLIQAYHHRTDTTFNTGYVIGIFAISFLFIKQPIIASFNIVSGLIVLFKSLKENLIELNSTTAISVSIVIMAAIGILGILCLTYTSIGISIKNKENKNELAYKQDYFKYITELGDSFEEPYINIKKDGKYGYINTKGEQVSEFKYDYASPFIEITSYNKKFYVALVCENGSSYIIMKNGRKVLSYRTESSDENYEAKLEELKNIYVNTLKQKEPMVYEIQEKQEYKTVALSYNDISSEYTFKYDYNDEYDISVTQSNMGLGDIYELVKKEDPNIKIKLDTTYLDYDSQYLYLFSNGTIPFYETSKRTQGWYTNYGKKNSMTGKAQILDFFGERMLLKNYNDKTVYFIDIDGNRLSDVYKDIYVCNDGRYIVRDTDTFCRVINDEYESLFEKKYAVINTRLLSENLYLVLDSVDGIKFNDYGYSKLNWKLMNYNGEIIFENIEQAYDLIYELPNDSEINEENYLKFQNELKDLKYNFVGDKFYLDY